MLLQQNGIIFFHYEDVFNATVQDEIDYIIGRSLVRKSILTQEKIYKITPLGKTLTTNAPFFSSIFDSSNIVVRIEGDEFMVYATHIFRIEEVEI